MYTNCLYIQHDPYKNKVVKSEQKKPSANPLVDTNNKSIL